MSPVLSHEQHLKMPHRHQVIKESKLVGGNWQTTILGEKYKKHAERTHGNEQVVFDLPLMTQ